jgi:hypothetical protein
MKRFAKRSVVALLLATFGTTGVAFAGREEPRRSEGVLEAVDTQMQTVEIRNGGGREKIAFDESTVVVRRGERVRVSKIDRGARLRIDWAKKGPKIVATRIEVVAAKEPAG